MIHRHAPIILSKRLYALKLIINTNWPHSSDKNKVQTKLSQYYQTGISNTKKRGILILFFFDSSLPIWMNHLV